MILRVAVKRCGGGEGWSGGVAPRGRAVGLNVLVGVVRAFGRVVTLELNGFMGLGVM